MEDKVKEFLIQGGKPLKGIVEISGSKNAALPAITATLLGKGDFLLTRVPRILDVELMLELLKKMGARFKWQGKDKVVINTDQVRLSRIDPMLACQLRASVLLAGPLLAKFGKIDFPHPGGCLIGKRPIDTHLSVFKQLGYQVEVKNDHYKISGKPKGGEIVLDKMSVTATENALMATAFLPSTLILGAASEPHIRNLAQFLKKMGVKIEGAGSYKLKIKGKRFLKGCTHQINPDDVEAGSFMIAAFATKGKVEIRGVETEDLGIISSLLGKMKAVIQKDKNRVIISPSNKILAQLVQVGPWPRIPTDLQPALTVLATQAKGESLIHDWMYERRFGYIDNLRKMGAEINKLDPHRVKVKGPTKLHGALVETPDIRAGFALVLAGLLASGETRIQKVELIERGFQDLDKKLKGLGAQIETRVL